MATRFGAASPAHTYQAKMRWMVGGLVVAIVILIITLVVVVKGSASQPLAEPVPDPSVPIAAPAAPAAPTVDILYALQRIEEGARLEAFMFDAQPVPSDRIPEGAILARDKQLIIGKFSKTMINANLPVINEYITDVRPISALNIPPGFRAVTITVDSRSGVEGFARPNSRVDVLWSYTDRQGQKAVATIVRFVKVLSVAGMTQSDGRAAVGGGSTTATLLVAERDAKKIELARTLGSLSLTLVGQEEPDKLTGELPEPVDIDSILGKKPEEAQQEQPNDGVMYTTDNRTGKQVRYVLRSGRWKRDEAE